MGLHIRKAHWICCSCGTGSLHRESLRSSNACSHGDVELILLELFQLWQDSCWGGSLEVDKCFVTTKWPKDVTAFWLSEFYDENWLVWWLKPYLVVTLYQFMLMDHWNKLQMQPLETNWLFEYRVVSGVHRNILVYCSVLLRSAGEEHPLHDGSIIPQPCLPSPLSSSG